MPRTFKVLVSDYGLVLNVEGMHDHETFLVYSNVAVRYGLVASEEALRAKYEAMPLDERIVLVLLLHDGQIVDFRTEGIPVEVEVVGENDPRVAIAATAVVQWTQREFGL